MLRLNSAHKFCAHGFSLSGHYKKKLHTSLFALAVTAVVIIFLPLCCWCQLSMERHTNGEKSQEKIDRRKCFWTESCLTSFKVARISSFELLWSWEMWCLEINPAFLQWYSSSTITTFPPGWIWVSFRLPSSCCLPAQSAALCKALCFLSTQGGRSALKLNPPKMLERAFLGYRKN